MRNISRIFIIALVALGLAGCEGMSKQDIGTLTGGAAGAALGSQFGHGGGRALAIFGGTVIGALVGGSIGQSMDKVDQMKMNQALESSKTGQVTRWHNPDSGNTYAVKPTKTYYRHNENSEQACREYTTTADIGGKKQQVYGRACRTSDGAWKIVK